MGDLPPLYKYSATPEIPAWPTRKRGPSKPVGVWLSVGDAWERWCRRENVFLEDVSWRRPVTLRSHARVLVMDNMSSDYSRFTKRYAHPADEFRVPVWDEVASDWDVLVLWPWAWSQAHHYRWDQAWDCPSGVVFTPDAISYGNPQRRQAMMSDDAGATGGRRQTSPATVR